MPEQPDSPFRLPVRQLFGWLYAAQNAVDGALGLRPPVSALFAIASWAIAVVVTRDIQCGVVAGVATLVTATVTLGLVEDGDARAYVETLRKQATDRANALAAKRQADAQQLVSKAEARHSSVTIDNTSAVTSTVESPIRCPACMSAQIHAAPRGWSLWSGFIGSGSTVLTCLKCGRRFRPGSHRR
jgi:hypothetical protein